MWRRAAHPRSRKRIESGQRRKARSRCWNERAFAMATCAGGRKTRGCKKSQRPWQIVSWPCNQHGERSALEAPRRISLRKFFKRIASGAPPVDPDQTGPHFEMDELAALLIFPEITKRIEALFNVASRRKLVFAWTRRSVAKPFSGWLGPLPVSLTPCLERRCTTR
jgi:hypothetical protein